MLIDPFIDNLPAHLAQLWQWVLVHVLTVAMFTQILVLSICIVVAGVIGNQLKARIKPKKRKEGMVWEWVRRVAPSLILPMLSLALVLLFLFAGRAFGAKFHLFEIAASLLTAWVVIRIITSSLLNRGIARFVGFLIWSVAALDILNILDPVTEALKAASINVGESTLSAYDVIWGLAMFALLIWMALLVSSMVDRRLKGMQTLAPSMRVLLGKVTRILLVSIAFLMALNASGIDLTVLAVFGGALGVGLGFGLQKVVSNFVSGLILLMDRSIKPGDVIEVQGTYGQINNLAARYTSVVTRDGTEYLIPNEDMITQVVVNWSHSNKLVRRKVLLAVEYDTDLRLAMDLMNKAAQGKERVVDNPAPRTLLRNFGDNGVELELRFWITDPENGVSNITSEVMLDIWDRFKAAGVEFPFPQIVVHKGSDMPSKPVTKNTKKS